MVLLKQLKQQKENKMTKTNAIIDLIFKLGVAAVLIVGVICAEIGTPYTALLISVAVIGVMIAFVKCYNNIQLCKEYSQEEQGKVSESEDLEEPDIPTRLRGIDKRTEGIRYDIERLGYKFGITLLRRDLHNKCFFASYKPDFRREEYEGVFNKDIFFRNADLIKDRFMVRFDNWHETAYIWDMYYSDDGRLFFGATMTEHRFNFMFEVTNISGMRILKQEDFKYAMDITISGDFRAYCNNLSCEGVDNFELRVTHNECIRQMLTEYQTSRLVLMEHNIGREEVKVEAEPKVKRVKKSTKKATKKLSTKTKKGIRK